jgi:hypothetical protein
MDGAAAVEHRKGRSPDKESRPIATRGFLSPACVGYKHANHTTIEEAGVWTTEHKSCC